MSEVKCIVIDNGTGTIKAGFSGDDAPTTVFPSIVGRQRPQGVMMGMGPKDAYVGNEAQHRRCLLSIHHPIERGIITNWDDMEKIWYHTFYNELRIAPEEHPVLLTEAPLNPKPHREKMTQIMFETFNTPAMHIENSARLALYASNRTTGIVVDSGDGVTSIVSVYESYVLPHATINLPYGGRDLTSYMRKLLVTRNYPLIEQSDLKIVCDIKEKLCYTPLQVHKSISLSSSDHTRTYTLPDGNAVSVKDERFECPEALFQPKLMDLHDAIGIHQAVHNSIQNCDVCIHQEMYSNIVLGGRSTLFDGFSQRMKQEMIKLAPATTEVGIITPEFEYATWIGGSVLSYLDSFRPLWITREEYDEIGPEIVHRKCF